MGEFFKGWRRKTGCITLAVACAFMAGWVRSQITVDCLILHTNEQTRDFLTSSHSGLSWERDRETLTDATMYWEGSDWFVFWSIPGKPEIEGGFFQTGTIKRRFEWCGFCIGELIYDDRQDSRIELSLYEVPYWSIVIPLILLSAYLLLSKPRVAKPKKMSEPIPAEAP